MTFFDPQSAALTDPASSPEEWMQALTTVLVDEMFSDTWTVEAGSACRAVFVFQDGLVMSWVGDGQGGEPAMLQAWAEPQASWFPEGEYSEPPVPCPVPGPFDWNSYTQVWEAGVDSASAADIITRVVQQRGPLQVLLPWDFLTRNEFVESLLIILGEGKPFAEALAAADEDKINEELTYIEEEESTFAPLIAAATLGGIVPPSAWGASPAEVMMGDLCLPPYSPLARFYRFVANMEDKDDWIVIWDECCGTCAGGTYEMMRTGSGLPEGAPALILFGQNAFMSWRPDGTFLYECYISDPAHVEVIAAEAAKVGITARVLEDSIELAG